MIYYCRHCGKRVQIVPVLNRPTLCPACKLLPVLTHTYDTLTGKRLEPMVNSSLTQDAHDDLLLSMIRQIVREEIRQALADEAEADEQDYTPRLVRIEGKPTITVQYEHEGMLYAGEVFPVERKI